MKRTLCVAMVLGAVVVLGPGCTTLLVDAYASRDLPRGDVAAVEVSVDTGQARVVYDVRYHPDLPAGRYFIDLPTDWAPSSLVRDERGGVLALASALYTNSDWRPLTASTGWTSAPSTRRRSVVGRSGERGSFTIVSDVNFHTRYGLNEDGRRGYWTTKAWRVYAYCPEREEWVLISTVGTGDVFWRAERRWAGWLLMPPAAAVDSAAIAVVLLVVGGF